MSLFSTGESISTGVKSRVMNSRLLTDDDYMTLLSSDSVAEIANKLSKTSYGAALEHLDDEPHRSELEAAIKTSIITEAKKMAAHLSKPRSNFFSAWLMMHEADNLKSIFRYIVSRRDDREGLRSRIYASEISTVDYDRLLAARSFSELADAFEGTIYQYVLEEPLKRLADGEETSIFPLETTLDAFLEAGTFRAMMMLPKAEREMLLPIFGARIDLKNLYMLYRASEFYSMTPEETLNRMLPVRYKVGLHSLRALARALTREAAEAILKERFPRYAEVIYKPLKEGEPQLAVERSIMRHLCNEAQRIHRTGLPGFHTVMSFFIIKEMEAADIIRIIECVRYGYDRRHALTHMIRTSSSSGGDTSWQ